MAQLVTLYIDEDDAKLLEDSGMMKSMSENMGGEKRTFYYLNGLADLVLKVEELELKVKKLAGDPE